MFRIVVCHGICFALQPAACCALWRGLASFSALVSDSLRCSLPSVSLRCCWFAPCPAFSSALSPAPCSPAFLCLALCPMLTDLLSVAPARNQGGRGRRHAIQSNAESAGGRRPTRMRQGQAWRGPWCCGLASRLVFGVALVADGCYAFGLFFVAWFALCGVWRVTRCALRCAACYCIRLTAQPCKPLFLPAACCLPSILRGTGVSRSALCCDTAARWGALLRCWSRGAPMPVICLCPCLRNTRTRVCLQLASRLRLRYTCSFLALSFRSLTLKRPQPSECKACQKATELAPGWELVLY